MAFDSLKLEKGLYTTGKSFTQALEGIDPSENYIGTEYEGLDAYQRQLKRFDIKVSGTNSDTISKFFNTTDSATLFPEFVSRAVRQGIQEKSVIDKIVATTTNIDSMDYRSIETIGERDDLELKVVSEGAHIPETHIKTKDKLTKLYKRGRTLVASYEAIKFQKLDLFTITLKQIGNYIAQSQVKDLIQEMLMSDIEQISLTSGYTYDDLLNVWAKLSPYDFTSILANISSISGILKIPEFCDANSGLNFHKTGELITPLGAELVKYSGKDLSGFAVCLDNKCAIQKIQVGDVMTEFDKLIDRQLEKATITTIAGFSVICPNAIKILMEN